MFVFVLLFFEEVASGMFWTKPHILTCKRPIRETGGSRGRKRESKFALRALCFLLWGWRLRHLSLFTC